MKDDDADSPSKTSGAAKSFIKKPKLTELSPKKLGTTLESDEFLQEPQLIQMKSDLPALSLDNNSSVSESKKPSLKNRDYNADGDYDEEKFDDDETSTALSSPHLSKGRAVSSGRYSENNNKASVNSLVSVKEDEQEKNLETRSGSLLRSATLSDRQEATNANRTNLLSKVIMESFNNV